MSNEKTLDYYKQNAEEDYMTVPISVLKYIGELESTLTTVTAERDRMREALEEIRKGNPDDPSTTVAGIALSQSEKGGNGNG